MRDDFKQSERLDMCRNEVTYMQRPPFSDRGADPGTWIRGADTPTGGTEPIISTTTVTLYEEVGS